MPSHNPDSEPPDSYVPDVVGYAELFGAIPKIFGFSPQSAIVVFTYHVAESARFGPAICFGLPGDDPKEIAHKVASLEYTLTSLRPTATMAVIIDDAHEADLPHAPLAAALQRLHAALGIHLVDIVSVPSVNPGAVWRSHIHAGNSGRVQDMTNSALAAARVLTGQVRYATYNELASTIEPDPDERLAARAAMLDARHRTATSHASTDQHQTWCDRIKDVLDKAAKIPDGLTLDDDTIVDLALALAEPDVRDCCLLATSTGTVGAERLWTALTRATPAPQRAVPAVMLALHHVTRGSEHLADVAIATALDADPNNVLAAILDECRRLAIAPETVRSYLAQAKASKSPCSVWS